MKKKLYKTKKAKKTSNQEEIVKLNIEFDKIKPYSGYMTKSHKETDRKK